MLEVNGQSAYKDRVNIILDELALGIQWERPSIIIVIYRSEHTKNMVQTILAKSLDESGQFVLDYVVDKYHYDIPLELMEHPGHKNTVFFVRALRWGGGRGYSNAYRALNMHREYLVEGNIRVIFWLTKKEMKQLARFSPDFWAFRHKVVEFLDLPSMKNVTPVESSQISFHDLYTKNANDFQIWIESAEKFYTQGCVDEAILNFRKALRKYPDEMAINLQIAEIYLSVGQHQIARRILNNAVSAKAENPEFLSALHQLEQKAGLIQQTCGGFSKQ